MTEMYKGERVTDLLAEVYRLEQILLKMHGEIEPFSQARYDEYCHAYAVLTIAKAKLKAIQGEKK